MKCDGLGYFVIGEKDGKYAVMAVCPSEEDAEDAAIGDEFDRIYVAEVIEVVG